MSLFKEPGISGSLTPSVILLCPSLCFSSVTSNFGNTPHGMPPSHITSRHAMLSLPPPPPYGWIPSHRIPPLPFLSPSQRGKMSEALQLARQSAGRPHFSHSLEWLLFTVFDAEMSR